jgi:PTS system mannose-specific IIB component
MITLVRLDERLIHGQIAIKWSRLLGVNRIVVADDEAAKSEIIQRTLMMAAPSTCKVAIVTVDKAIKLCNDPRSENLKIFIIVSELADLLKIVNEVHNIPEVNIGNYGRIAQKKNGQQRVAYSNNLYLYDSEIDILKKVINTGIPCHVQTIPDDIPQNLQKIIGYSNESK